MGCTESVEAPALAGLGQPAKGEGHDEEGCDEDDGEQVLFPEDVGLLGPAVGASFGFVRFGGAAFVAFDERHGRQNS